MATDRLGKNMNEIEYQQPSMEVVDLGGEDVICASGDPYIKGPDTGDLVPDD